VWSAFRVPETIPFSVFTRSCGVPADGGVVVMRIVRVAMQKIFANGGISASLGLRFVASP
jgi:hypothetical protein